MKTRHTILIIEDQEVNRALLEEMLKADCNVLQAENGKEGLKIVAEREDIAAIVLDIIMPVMDGFAFLEQLSAMPGRRSVPVIVATEYGVTDNEKKALELGAYDFISKPYDPTVVRLRIHNAIEHSRLVTLEKIKYLEEFDGLTGIYNKDSFQLATRQMLSEAPEEDDFAIIRFDMTRFAMINAYYGVKEGDRLLKYIAELLFTDGKKNPWMTYARIGGDEFCVCTKYGDITQLYSGINFCCEKIAEYDLSFNINPTFGIYLINDRNIEVETMIANASLAAKINNSNYLSNVAIYDERLAKRTQDEQIIINEMKTALETEQFVVFIQPKYSSHTDKPCGGEALIRWKHPERGMVSPGVFIPVFESNGFIEPVDHYMWEHVCMILRKWIDEGKELMPISVNVSRVNLYNPNIVEEISTLTDKYNVPKELLQLEITESAYTEDEDMILDVINKFHDSGFTILMDDFGSGYSSLNVLKDMKVDVLKIDMKFFGKTENADRADTIISAVVKMANDLSIGTVAEGVETAEQVAFLKEVGCSTIQGYFFAKPMPVSEFEELIQAEK